MRRSSARQRDLSASPGRRLPGRSIRRCGRNCWIVLMASCRTHSSRRPNRPARRAAGRGSCGSRWRQCWPWCSGLPCARRARSRRRARRRRCPLPHQSPRRRLRPPRRPRATRPQRQQRRRQPRHHRHRRGPPRPAPAGPGIALKSSSRLREARAGAGCRRPSPRAPGAAADGGRLAAGARRPVCIPRSGRRGAAAAD